MKTTYSSTLNEIQGRRDQLAEAERWVPLMRKAIATLEMAGDQAKFKAPPTIQAIRNGRSGGISGNQAIPEMREAAKILSGWDGLTGLVEYQARLDALPAQIEVLESRLPTPEQIAKAKAQAQQLATAASKARADAQQSAADATPPLDDALVSLQIALSELDSARSHVQSWEDAKAEAQTLADRYGVATDLGAGPRIPDSTAVETAIDAISDLVSATSSAA